MTRFSWLPIHSRVRNAAWVGAGIELVVSFQASKVFPVGNPAGWRFEERAMLRFS